jgi:hypothetical protein
MAITQAYVDTVRVPRGRRGPYAVAGVAAVLLALAFFSWAGYSVHNVGGGDYVKSLVDASRALKERKFADVYHLVEGLILAVAGGLALAGRRVAKGALVTVSALVLYESGYRLIGLHDHYYRELYTHTTEDKLNLATFVAGTVIALLIIGLMLAAGSSPPGGGQAGYVPQQQGWPQEGWQQQGWQQPPAYPAQPGHTPTQPGGYAQPPEDHGGYGFPQPPSHPPGGGY